MALSLEARHVAPPVTLELDGDPQHALACLEEVLHRTGFTVERGGLSTLLAQRGSRLGIVLLGAVEPHMRVEAHAITDREHGQLQLWVNPGEAHNRLSTRRADKAFGRLVDALVESLGQSGLGGRRAA
ncbi:MAG: hypothetical protein HYX34_03325 [Actinobacteria bacterium]|nr:hypothetical protein [Actinomycetota bacterium]